MKGFLTLSMLLYILNRKKVTAKELAEKYEYSVRTIYRYLDQLLMAEVPLRSKPGVNGGIWIADSFKVNNLFFTEKELKMLENGLNGAKSLYPKAEYDDLQDKLLHLEVKEKEYTLSTDELIIDGLPWGSTQDTENKISTLKDAIADKKIITIEYHDRAKEKSTRDVEPHTLVLKNGMWYLIAYCHKAKGFRSFKISRIETITILDKTFTRREFKYSEIMEITKSKEDIELVLEVKKDARVDVEDWIGKNKVKESKGKIIASTTLPITETLIGEIMSFGDKVKVISPEPLVAKIKERIKKMETLY